jgi:hypothetical protein
MLSNRFSTLVFVAGLQTIGRIAAFFLLGFTHGRGGLAP